MEALRRVEAAGLVDVETHEVVVQRTFADFDTFWAAARKGPRIAPGCRTCPAATPSC